MGAHRGRVRGAVRGYRRTGHREGRASPPAIRQGVRLLDGRRLGDGDSPLRHRSRVLAALSRPRRRVQFLLRLLGVSRPLAQAAGRPAGDCRLGGRRRVRRRESGHRRDGSPDVSGRREFRARSAGVRRYRHRHGRRRPQGVPSRRRARRVDRTARQADGRGLHRDRQRLLGGEFHVSAPRSAVALADGSGDAAADLLRPDVRSEVHGGGTSSETNRQRRPPTQIYVSSGPSSHS